MQVVVPTMAGMKGRIGYAVAGPLTTIGTAS
jgi:hypothetical protein